jgi:DNA-binding LacI/PurR family transcriptional regulator
MAKRITLNDIAVRCGVSASTVSLALRSRPGLPEETRKRVQEAAKALGYDVASKTMAPARVSQIGVLMRMYEGQPMQAEVFYSHVLAGIESACRRHSINLLYAHVPVLPGNRCLEIPSLLESGHMDGLLLVGVYVDDALRSALQQKSLPTVVVNAYQAVEVYDSILSPNYGASYSAVQYLIRKGHRHIGMIGSPVGTHPGLDQRRLAYLHALRDHDIPDSYFVGCFSHTSDDAVDEITQVTSDLLRDHPQITALFGCNDQRAIHAMLAARALGRRLPEELSVIGHDDIDAARVVTPPLTTMRVDKSSMGQLAVRVLMQRVQDPSFPPIQSIVPVTLIERGSVNDISNRR